MKNILTLITITVIVLFLTSCTYKNIYNTATIKQIPIDEYISKIQNINPDSLIIIDVRTTAEYNQGHYPNAVNVNFFKSFKKDTKNMDTTKTVFIYCETAHRSPYAAKFLKQNGFTKIYDLKKGYSQIRKKSKKYKATK